MVKKYTGLLLLSYVLPLIAMEEDIQRSIAASLKDEEQRKSREETEQKQYEQTIAESLKDLTSSEQSALQSLPDEIKSLILFSLSSDKGFLETMKEITKMSLVHPYWKGLANDPQLLKVLVHAFKTKNEKSFYDDFVKAAKSGALPVINAMLEYDPDLPKQRWRNLVPNAIAAVIARESITGRPNTRIIERLLQEIPQSDVNKLHSPSLILAVERNRLDAARLLIGKEPQLVDWFGILLRINSVPMLNLFIEAGANKIDLLMVAVINNNLPMITRLIDLKTDLNYLDKRYETVLMKAVQWRNIEAVRKLLEAGADPNVIGTGKTALDIALEKNYEDIANMLLEHGAGK